MSQRTYAKRRGVSHVAVQKAIRTGRLRESVRDGKIVDADLADREWDATTDLTRASPAQVAQADRKRRGGDAPALPDEGTGFARGDAAPSAGDDPAPSAHEGMTLSEATATEKIWRAKQAELKFRREAAELVPSVEVRGKLEAVFSVCRTKLLGVPSRARQTLPHLTVADIAALEDLVREALEDLAAGNIA